ncbi:unnamed protein product [Musa textilis]
MTTGRWITRAQGASSRGPAAPPRRSCRRSCGPCPVAPPAPARGSSPSSASSSPTASSSAPTTRLPLPTSVAYPSTSPTSAAAPPPPPASPRLSAPTTASSTAAPSSPPSPALPRPPPPSPSPSQAASGTGDQDDDLDKLERLQVLLDLLMQIRPYADGMEVSLVLEAMDCVVIEIFEVYSSICSGIAHFLVGILGPDQYGAMTEARRRRGRVGMRILRRAAAQNSQLSSYFDLCRALGVLNAAELPPVEGIPEKDMDDLERMVLGGTTGSDEEAAAVAVAGNGGGRAEREVQGKTSEGHFGTVITKEWVVFEDEGHCGTEGRGHFGHSTCRAPVNIWPSTLWAQREWQSHPSDLSSSVLI